MKFFFVCVWATLLSISLVAQVRSPDFSAQVFTPGPQIASAQDAWSLFTNPAGLSFVDGAELVGGYNYSWNNPSNLHQAQLSTAFGIIEGLSLGLGLGLALPSNTTTESQGDVNAQLGLAYRLGRSFSLGAWTFKQRRYALDSSDPFLLGLGFQYYPIQFLAFGGTAKQVYGSFGSPLEFQVGASLRPFGKQFTIFGETRFWPNHDSWKTDYQISPIAGARLDLDGFSLIASAVIQKNPLFMFSIDINWEHFGFGPLGGNDYVGGRFRFSSEAYTHIDSPAKKWAKIELNSNGTLESGPTSIADQFFKKPSSPVLFLNSLDKLASDPKIEGVLVTLDSLDFGFGRAEELRNSLLALKNSGKQVIIYLNNPSVIDYYVATAGNKIYLNPSGELSLDRFRKTLVYLKKGLDELGVEAEVISAGAYKSAPRPLIANAPNAQELEVTNAILDEQYSHFIEAISQKTKKSAEQIKGQINLGILTAPEALASGFVDALAEPSDVSELQHSYANYFGVKKKNTIWGIPNQIAIIPISGTIVAGRSTPSFWFPRSQTGAEDTIESLEKASNNPHVKGILLRIDSPGGDSFASDQIYRAVVKARQKKPVVASMADIAASGGYYAAAGANQIWAEPSTLTGSIGVFSLRFSVQKLLSKLGISSFELKRGALPGPSLFRPLSPAERERGQQLVDWTYARFKQAVSQGQNLDLDLVSKLAEGRVWTGEQAFENKLVQNLGGFSQALAQLKNLAGIQASETIQLNLYQPSHGYSFSLNPLASVHDLVEHQGRTLTLMPFIL